MKFVEGNLYKRNMAEALRRMKKPVPFTLDIAENEYEITLIVYAEDIKPMTHGQVSSVMEYLFAVKDLFESYGPYVEIQGVPGAPKRI